MFRLNNYEIDILLGFCLVFIGKICCQIISAGSTEC